MGVRELKKLEKERKRRERKTMEMERKLKSKGLGQSLYGMDLKQQLREKTTEVRYLKLVEDGEDEDAVNVMRWGYRAQGNVFSGTQKEETVQQIAFSMTNKRGMNVVDDLDSLKALKSPEKEKRSLVRRIAVKSPFVSKRAKTRRFQSVRHPMEPFPGTPSSSCPSGSPLEERLASSPLMRSAENESDTSDSDCSPRRRRGLFNPFKRNASTSKLSRRATSTLKSPVRHTPSVAVEESTMEEVVPESVPCDLLEVFDGADEAEDRSEVVAAWLAEVESDAPEIMLGAEMSVRLDNKVGKGANATVYRGDVDGDVVAVKQVYLEGVKNRSVVRKALRQEVDILKAINHKNIMRCYGCYYNKLEMVLSIVSEYVELGSLRDWMLMRDISTLPEGVVAAIVAQCLVTLCYLGDRLIMHRDIKPENLLLAPSGWVKLADFGCAVQIAPAEKRYSSVGTPWYVAPEVIMGEGYGTACDVWSIGCCMVELLTGTPPFGDANPIEALFRMAEEDIDIPINVSRHCHLFMKACLERDPAARPTPRTLLAHRFLARTADPHLEVADYIKRNKGVD